MKALIYVAMASIGILAANAAHASEALGDVDSLPREVFLTGGVPVPAQELVLIPAFQTIRLARVTSTQSQQIQQSLQGQGKKPTLLVHFVGDTALQGNVADLGIQQLLQQAQSQAGASGGQGQSTTTT